jgi:hypothetical protein
MKIGPFGGRSSETSSRPIDMNNILRSTPPFPKCLFTTNLFTIPKWIWQPSCRKSSTNTTYIQCIIYTNAEETSEPFILNGFLNFICCKCCALTLKLELRVNYSSLLLSVERSIFSDWAQLFTDSGLSELRAVPRGVNTCTCMKQEHSSCSCFMYSLLWRHKNSSCCFYPASLLFLSPSRFIIPCEQCNDTSTCNSDACLLDLKPQALSCKALLYNSMD